MTKRSNELHDADSTWKWFMRTGLAVTLAAVTLAIFPYTPRPALEIKLLIIAWAAALLGIGCVVGTWSAKDRLRRPGPLVAILAAWLLWTLITAIVSDHPGNSLRHVLERGSLLVLAWVAGQVSSKPEHLRRLMAVICWAALAATIYAFFQRAGIDPFPWSTREDDAYTGLPATYGNANFAAHALALCIVFALALARGRVMFLYLPMAAAFTVHLAYTGQRGAWVALGAAIIFMGFLSFARRRSMAPARAALFSVGATFVSGVVIAAAVMAIQAGRSGHALPLDGSVLLRYNGYLSASEMITDRPVFGFGLGNYEIENAPYWTPYEQRWFAERLRMNAHVHNDLLESAVSGGILSGVFYLAFFLVAVGMSIACACGSDRSKSRLGMSFAAWFWVFFIDGLFGFNLRVPVTATFLFVFAGALDGVFMPHRTLVSSASQWTFRVAVGAAAILFTITASTEFFASILFKSGMFAMESGKLPVAEAHFKRVERLVPSNWQYAWKRGEVHFEAGNYVDAINHYNRSLELHPNFIVALASRGRAYLRLASQEGEPGESREISVSELLDRSRKSAQETLDLAPGFPAGEEVLARVALAEARQIAQRGGDEQAFAQTFKAAERHARAALRYAPDGSSGLYLILFQALAGQGKQEAALRAITQAVSVEPTNPENWSMFYAFAVQNGRMEAFRESARAAYGKLSESGQVMPVALELAGHVWEEGEEQILDSMTTLAAAATALPPEEKSAKRLRELAWAMEEFLTRLPETGLTGETKSLIRFYAGRTFAAFNVTSRAMPLLAQALADLPRDEKIAAAAYLAQGYSDQGKHDVALNIARDALQYGATDLNLRLAFARVLARAGQTAEARMQYQAILRSFDLPQESVEVIKSEYNNLQ